MSEPAPGASPIDDLCCHLAGLTQAVKDLQAHYGQLEGRIQDLSATVATLSSGTGPAPGRTVVALPSEPKVPLPERFTGDRSKFQAFQNSCELYFALQPRTFALEATKVGLVISLLTGAPQAWAHRLLQRKAPEVSNLTTFFQAMAQLYSDPHQTATAEAALCRLQQGRRPVEDYAVEFQRWAADTAWNDAALCHQFRLGLSESLKDELAWVRIPRTLSAMITATTQLDQRLREHRAEHSASTFKPTWMLPRVASPPSVVPPVSSIEPSDIPEPMQLGLSRPSLTVEERQRRLALGVCLYCGEPGHLARSCPNKPGKPRSPVVKEQVIFSGQAAHLLISLSLQLAGGPLQIQAVVDSGACSCFIDKDLVAAQQIPLQPKAQRLLIKLADGSNIKSGAVTHETLPLQAIIASDHRELLTLDVITSPLFPVILGLPWLRAHNPTINWVTGSLTFGSLYCRQHCWRTVPQGTPALLGLNSKPEPEAHNMVPAVYHVFLEGGRGVATPPGLRLPD